jgi:two-component system KDP operon response regulator KdpE
MGEPSPPPIPKAHILVVEDEFTTRVAITEALNIVGYSADEAASGEEALAMLDASYDLMLLDLRMPGIDGLQVMKQVQESHPDLLVIVLTAYASLENAIEALKAGATDFLLKPVGMQAIESAITQALQHRQDAQRRYLANVIARAAEALQGGPQQVGVEHPVSPGRFIHRGPLQLDVEKDLVMIRRARDQDSHEVLLTTSESALLAHLMKHPGAILSCRELAQDALDYTVTEKEARKIIRPHIARLRKKLEIEPSNPQLIQTVRDKGYTFIGP